MGTAVEEPLTEAQRIHRATMIDDPEAIWDWIMALPHNAHKRRRVEACSGAIVDDTISNDERYLRLLRMRSGIERVGPM